MWPTRYFVGLIMAHAQVAVGISKTKGQKSPATLINTQLAAIATFYLVLSSQIGFSYRVVVCDMIRRKTDLFAKLMV